MLFRSPVSAIAAVLLAAGAALAAAPPPAAPGTANGPQAPGHGTRVVLLGTGGGPVIRTVHGQPASLVIVDGHPYLIDAGAGVVERIVEAGFQPYQIGRIFMTHYHPDHDAGLVPLISSIWVDRNAHRMGAKDPVQIFGPPATNFLLHSALNFVSVSERIFGSEGMVQSPAEPMFAAHRIDHAGVVYRDARLCIIAVENMHYHFPKGSPAAKAGDKSYAYRFNTPNGSVVFTGDTGPSAAVTRLAHGADILVSNVIDEDAIKEWLSMLPANMNPKVVEQIRFHMMNELLVPEEVGKMATRAHVKAVLLTHLVPGLDTEHDPAMYTASVRRIYDGPVIAGRDLFKYNLPEHANASSPSCD